MSEWHYGIDVGYQDPWETRDDFPEDRPSPSEYQDEPVRLARCYGAGEIEVGTHRDEFGTWETETYECPGCLDCER